MNKNIKRISSGAAAVVMALTTAVYVPGFANTASAADNDAANCVYRGSDNSNIISDDTWETWKGADNTEDGGTDLSGKVVLTGATDCVYEIGTLTKDIVIAKGANITISVNSDNTGYKYNGEIENNGTLTIKEGNKAITGDITSTGTLTIDGAEFGKLTVTDGLTTISAGKANDTVTAEDKGEIKITGGTFDEKVSKEGSGIVSATGGKFKESENDATAVEAIRLNQSYKVYTVDDYNVLEKAFTADDVVFNAISFNEGETIDFVGASVEGSQTEFKYEIFAYDDAAEDKKGAKITDDSIIGLTDENKKITSTVPGTYHITATSTLDPTVKKDALITVASILDGIKISTSNADDAEAIENYSINITNTNSNYLYPIITKTGANAEIKEVAIVDGTGENVVESDVVTARKGTAANKTVAVVAAKGDKIGTANVRITASDPKGTTTVTTILPVTVEDELNKVTAKNESISVLAGQTITTEDLINLFGADYETVAEFKDETEADKKPEYTLEGVTYSIKSSSNKFEYTHADAEDDSSAITAIKAGDETADDEVFTITATHDTVSKTAEVKISIIDALDEIAWDDTEIALGEDSTVAKEASLEGVTAYDDFMTSVDYEIVDEEGNAVAEADQLFTIAKATEEVEGKTVDVQTAIKLTAKAGAGVGEQYVKATYHYTVSGESKDATSELLKVTVAPEFRELTITDKDGKVIASDDGTESEAYLEVVAGSSEVYTLTPVSPNAKIASATVTYANESEKKPAISSLPFDSGYNTFTINASSNLEASGTVTINAEGVDGETFTITLNVVVKKYEQVNQLIADGIYTIAASEDNDFVLDINGASTKEGANTQLYKANGTAAQKFYIRYAYDGYYTIENLKSGLYLSVDQATNNVSQKDLSFEDDPETVVNEAIRGDTALWYATENSDGTITFANRFNGLTLDIASNSMSNGANVQAYAGNNTNAQKFVLSSVATATTNNEKYAAQAFKIASAKKEDMVLDAKYGGSKNGTNVWLYDSNYEVEGDMNLSQVFIFNMITDEETGAPTGFYRIIAGTTPQDAGDKPLVLDVASAKDANEANVQLYEWNGTIAQQWMIVENDDDTISIISRVNGRALDLRWAGTSNGTNVQIYEQNGTIAQKFVLKAVEVED